MIQPYSSPDPAVREQRFHDACRATAGLLRAGLSAYSPVVHGHPLAEHGLPTSFDFWEQCDREHLERSDAAVVLLLEGWRESLGVRAEIQLARSLSKPIVFATLRDLVSHWSKTSRLPRLRFRPKEAES